MYRVFFHPFPQDCCKSIVNYNPTSQADVVTEFGFDPALTWHHAHSGNIFYADDPDKTLENGVNILKKDLQNSVLYVIGQCTAGSDYFYSLNYSEKNGTGQRLNAEELLQMVELIVPSKFTGFIKLFACKSGLNGAKGALSFSMKFAPYAMGNWRGAKLVAYTAALGILALRDDARQTGQFIRCDDEAQKAGQHRWAIGSDKRAKQCQIITNLK
jgi:hypothetical protein